MEKVKLSELSLADLTSLIIEYDASEAKGNTLLTVQQYNIVVEELNKRIEGIDFNS